MADTDLAVLVLGENGTGKEVVAQSIHYPQPPPRPAVRGRQLRGHPREPGRERAVRPRKRGVHRRQARPGRASSSWPPAARCFLDEIGDLSLAGQAKLLRVLEEKVMVRVGGSTPIPTDARMLAATNQDLAEMVRQKRFREDLYFRLNVVTLEAAAACGSGPATSSCWPSIS